MKLFNVSYEIPPLKAIRNHLVLAKDESTNREIVFRWFEYSSKIKRVREYDLNKKGVIS